MTYRIYFNRPFTIDNLQLGLKHEFGNLAAVMDSGQDKFGWYAVLDVDAPAEALEIFRFKSAGKYVRATQVVMEKTMKKTMDRIKVDERTIIGDNILEPGDEFVLKEMQLYSVLLDVVDPDDRDFKQYMKRHDIFWTIVNPSGPGAGFPEVEFVGQYQALVNMLDDIFFDPDLAEYIEPFHEDIEALKKELNEMYLGDLVDAMESIQSYLEKNVAGYGGPGPESGDEYVFHITALYQALQLEVATGSEFFDNMDDMDHLRQLRDLF